MFNKIQKGSSYSRPQLAKLWGYASFHAIARGVITPKNTNKIILFVTEEKQSFQEQYQDRLRGGTLNWEGPTDHFAEQRIIDASTTGDEIHLFYRERHHSDFTYFGLLALTSYQPYKDKPSSFVFEIIL